MLCHNFKFHSSKSVQVQIDPYMLKHRNIYNITLLFVPSGKLMI